MINRTDRTMTDLGVELSVTGSFSIIEKPTKITLDAGERRELRAIIKVNSTETGYIFGSIAVRYAICVGKAIVIGALMPPLVRILRERVFNTT